MLVLRGMDGMDEMGEMGSWLTDRLGKTGAGIAIGAAVLGTGYAANSYFNLGIGGKTANLVNRITGSTTAGRIATELAPAATTMAVAAAVGSGDGPSAPSGPSPEEVQAAQIAQAQQIQQSKPFSPWIPLGIIATVAGGWFAFKG